MPPALILSPTSAEPALYVPGNAIRDDERYRFEWSFRFSLEYSNCGELEFESGASDQVEIRVRGQVLFQADLDDDALLQFDDYANADADGDADITIEELHGVALPAGTDHTTLGEQLYLGLAPKVPRFRDIAHRQGRTTPHLLWRCHYSSRRYRIGQGNRNPKHPSKVRIGSRRWQPRAPPRRRPDSCRSGNPREIRARVPRHNRSLSAR